MRHLSGATALVTGTRRAGPRRPPRVVEVRAHTRAPASAVWSVLADPHSFARWVRGTAAVHDADPGWPSPGSRLHHSFGPLPVRVRDRTTVVAADPPHLLVLEALARPLAVVRVQITVTDCTRDTQVTLREEMLGGLGAWLARPAHLIQLRRNRRSLAALLRLSEQR